MFNIQCSIKHNYYPEFAANLDSISFTGTVIHNTFGLARGTGIYVNLELLLGEISTEMRGAFDLVMP
jgi:hypothetical protein